MLERPLCLVGLRCTGKTTLVPALGSALVAPALDLDRELVLEGTPARAASDMPPGAGELLSRLGEAGFRALEARVLERLLDREPAPVIATGAGCVETPRARELLRDRATTVWLQVPLVELARRMRADPTFRPALLAGDPVAEIPLVAARREPLYRSVAHLVLDCGGDPVERLVARILELVRHP